MSEYAKLATVDLALTDFANTDSAGKGNLIGAGVAVVGFQAPQGLTARIALWVAVHLPTALCPAEFPVEISLLDGAGELFNLPGPSGDQPLRMAQIVTLEKPNLPIPVVQRDHIGSRSQIVVEFAGGLPLVPGQVYTWQVRLDGDVDRQWTYPFAVVGPQPSAVFG